MKSQSTLGDVICFQPETRETVNEGAWDRAEKWRKEEKISGEEKGYNFPCVINFQSQVPRSFLLKPVFPLAAGQRLLTPLTFFLMSLGRHLVVTFQAMNTCLRRKIAYQMPSQALRRKESANQAEFFLHTIINVSGAQVLPHCWPPTSGISDWLGEEKGAFCSYLSGSKLHSNSFMLSQRAPVSRLCLPTKHLWWHNTHSLG